MTMGVYIPLLSLLHGVAPSSYEYYLKAFPY